MKITDFSYEHINEATELALANYDEERGHVPALPRINAIPDLSGFAENGLGVSAFNGGKMVGFLCCYEPFDNAFGSTNVKGVFSPMGSNAAVTVNRAKIYAAMYQAAGKKWVHAGAVSHAVSLYAHDRTANEQFFRYGFGLRSVDAIRYMEATNDVSCDGYEFMKLPQERYAKMLLLENMLDDYMKNSPIFMRRRHITKEELDKWTAQDNMRYFTASVGEKFIAFLEVSRGGETFIKDAENYLHIGGAFCLPEHRGKGVYQNLMNYAIRTLKNEGFTRLGVDFESFNPSGTGFWLKHFSVYTHGVVRRIDENILELNSI